MGERSQPTRDVFISHSTADKQWADEACTAIEARKISCWIAPRDILPGSEWGAAIIEGIDACRVMVLIFSQDANSSPQVRREIERAIGKGLIVLPFRVEDVKPSGALEFALSNTHWLDGFKSPKQRQLDLLGESLTQLLAGGGSITSRMVTQRAKSPSRVIRICVIGGALLLAAALVTAWVVTGRYSGGDAKSTEGATMPLEPTKPVRSAAAVLLVDGPLPRQFRGIMTMAKAPPARAQLLVVNVEERDGGKTGTFTGILEWNVGKPGHDSKIRMKMTGEWSEDAVTMKSFGIIGKNQNIPVSYTGIVSGGRLNGSWKNLNGEGGGTLDLRAND